MTVPWWPVIWVDVIGSTAVVALSIACILAARRWSAGNPEDPFRHYVFLLTLAIGVFAISRSLGHLVRYALVFLGMRKTWSVISPFSGAINTASFIAVFAFSIYFERQLRVKLKADEAAVELATARAIASAASENEARLHAILDGMEDAIYVIDEELRIKFFNRKMKSLLPVIEVGSACHAALKNLPSQCEVCGHKDTLENGQAISREFELPSLRKSFNVLEIPIVWVDGGRVRLNVARDVTEHKKLEEQLRQAQKMESIGRLAGGVAHDFNNVLSSILGYGELAAMRLPEGHPVREDLRLIVEAGEKAASLTQQLLAFSRKQVLEMRVIDLNAAVERMGQMLDRVIGEDVALEIARKSTARNIRADLGQIEQVLMNLAVNARDAMPQGGRLIIETSDAELDEAYARTHEGVSPGRYVALSITDTGEGMTKEVQEKIFEPFFTTKEVGKGTGLGLATVYGIVKQHQGHISVYSEVGKGTSFRIFFPLAESAPTPTPTARQTAEIRRGSETVLVVDDSAPIRRLIIETLRPLGYRMLEAPSGPEAMRIGGEIKGRIDLLITDVVMPGMNGRELSEHFASLHPETKTIFMSGYTDAAILPPGSMEGAAFIQKPVVPSILAMKMRETLDRRLRAEG